VSVRSAISSLGRLCTQLNHRPLPAAAAAATTALRRWPFWRMGGLQEPGATFFSMMNLLAHYRGLAALRRVPAARRSLAHGWYVARQAVRSTDLSSVSPTPTPTRCSYVALSFVSMNAWMWATVFHSRDRPLTEALDYHSASAVQITAAVVAVVRVFELSPRRRYRLDICRPLSAVAVSFMHSWLRRGTCSVVAQRCTRQRQSSRHRRRVRVFP
jgi:hypothetical protein